MKNATMCNLTTAEVSPFHEKKYEIAVGKGDDVVFVDWRAWSEFSQSRNKVSPPVEDQPQIPETTAGIPSLASLEVEGPAPAASAVDPLEDVSLRRLASVLLRRVFR